MTLLHRVFLSADRTIDRIARERFAGEFAASTKGFVTGPDLCASPPRDGEFALIRHVRREILRDTTVTIVLIGPRTWALRRVDAEIRASLVQTLAYDRSGLLGILLPDYAPLNYRDAVRLATDPARNTWSHGNVPETLWRNTVTGYASIRPYPRDAVELSDWIRAAWLRRYGTCRPDESGALLVCDHPREVDAWTLGAARP